MRPPPAFDLGNQDMFTRFDYSTTQRFEGTTECYDCVTGRRYRISARFLIKVNFMGLEVDSYLLLNIFSITRHSALPLSGLPLDGRRTGRHFLPHFSILTCRSAYLWSGQGLASTTRVWSYFRFLRASLQQIWELVVSHVCSCSQLSYEEITRLATLFWCSWRNRCSGLGRSSTSNWDQGMCSSLFSGTERFNGVPFATSRRLTRPTVSYHTMAASLSTDVNVVTRNVPHHFPMPWSKSVVQRHAATSSRSTETRPLHCCLFPLSPSHTLTYHSSIFDATSLQCFIGPGLGYITATS
ncbi:hypothetical protein BDV96DRAFT_162721 [Lophiotrema nucula]|uniref:Uncharacterized protein n=1 Tax=Lophiotrema nucula TaxID=690887 RepID=A0A6A5YZ66_9PLEO|nr:hypothetical protein BDV96DRAFT_162721 [Lophiotrema nucula]